MFPAFSAFPFISLVFLSPLIGISVFFTIAFDAEIVENGGVNGPFTPGTNPGGGLGGRLAHVVWAFEKEEMILA
jgi:hypothetical protein